jgi:CBS domain-containing protein
MTKGIETMKVMSLIGDDVVFVAPDADLFAVADALTDNNVGALAVGDGKRVAGVVSERDLVHALALRRDPASVTAGDIANTSLVWCDASSTVRAVAAQMMDHYVRHVLVERKGRLVGMVSARDLLGAFASGGALV